MSHIVNYGTLVLLLKCIELLKIKANFFFNIPQTCKMVKVIISKAAFFEDLL